MKITHRSSVYMSDSVASTASFSIADQLVLRGIFLFLCTWCLRAVQKFISLILIEKLLAVILLLVALQLHACMYACVCVCACGGGGGGGGVRVCVCVCVCVCVM